jgi:CRP-like cAMP-binding protein
MTRDDLTGDVAVLDRAFIEQVEASRLGWLKNLARGEVLYWQGDPVEAIFIVSSGSLK